MRHRILLQTDPTTVYSGLAENAKTLLKYLFRTGKYDVAHMWCQGTSTLDPRLNLTPWKSFGCIPPDQNLINQINSDMQLQRNATYGSYNIDAVVKEWKPTIWVGSNDAWSFPVSDYCDKPWYNQINSVHHITIDSVPVCDIAFDQAKKSKYYLTWARFAVDAMKRARSDGSMNHVGSIYGAMNTELFSPISEQEKLDMRKRFGIAPETVVFQYVFRNQLRKSANLVMEAYARFKKDRPQPTALHLHTSFTEKGMGWDIPKMAAFYGINPNEILSTYVCKTCKNWMIAPYRGDDIDCPLCGAKKSMITPNLQNGVPPTQMRFIYGFADAALSCFTSGGQEYHNCQALLCGKPLACTNYSCGEDFCASDTKGFVTPIGWHPYHEQGTNFVKAASDVGQIAEFMRYVLRQSKRDLQEIGERGRAWATKTFGIESIGPQWERFFDAMPMPDWSSITLTPSTKKNDQLPMPGVETNDTDFVQALYKNVLLMAERLDGEGQMHWEQKLKAGVKREDVYQFFIQTAQQENAKSQPPQDLMAHLDQNGRKRICFVIKESIGDVAICTALFKSAHEQTPGADLYVVTDPKYVDVLIGNEHVHKVLAYSPVFENELAMIGQGKGTRYFDVFYHPGITTQRHLAYLSRPEPAFDLYPYNPGYVGDLIPLMTTL